jgi:hypothetical protein
MRVSLSAPAKIPAAKLSAISTGASAFGLLGRCGNTRSSNGRKLTRCGKARNVAWPACALSLASVVVILIVLPPVLSLISSVTVW